MGLVGRGLWWLGGSQVAQQTLHVGVRVALARLLAPQAFGVMAMAMVFISLTRMIADLGMAAPLVQRRSLDESHKSTMFWSVGALSVGMTLLLWLLAPLIGAMYRSEEIVPVLRVLSLTFVVSVPEVVFAALLTRDMNFRLIAIRRLLAEALGAAVGLGSAILGAGVWALVAYALVSQAAGSALLALYGGWKPKLTFSWEAFRELGLFGSLVLASRGLIFVGRNLDTFLIGRYLGAASLGLYNLGFQAVLLPLTYLVRPAGFVTMPAFARLRDDMRRCRAGYLRAVELVVATCWPLSAFAVLVAPTAIPRLLGEQWAGAVVPFQFLAGVGAAQAIYGVAPPLLLGLGHPNTHLKLTLFSTAMSTAAFIVGLRWGITGVAVAYFIATVLTLPVHQLVIARIIACPKKRIAAVLLRGAMASSIPLVVWYLYGSLVAPTESIRHLALRTSVSAVAYLLASGFLLTNAWAIMRRVVRIGGSV